MLMITGFRKLIARFGQQDDPNAPRKCPCCSRTMSYFPHMSVVGNGMATPRIAAWGCIYCGR